MILKVKIRFRLLVVVTNYLLGFAVSVRGLGVMFSVRVSRSSLSKVYTISL